MEYQLKVCGLTQLNQITELINLQVDFLGFIFYDKSPRYVLEHLSLTQISEINHQGKVGVFVNETINKILEISEKAQLNYIQLHGDENANFVSDLRQKLNSEIGIIKVIRIPFVIPRNEESQKLFTSLLSIQTDIDYILFDTDSKAFGGTGKTFDWRILNELDIKIPYFLSGGISLENTGDLKNINQKPVALDINSKFEIEPGNKNLEKIKKIKKILET